MSSLLLKAGFQWFPMEYYGNEDVGGVNGHFYHVFNTVCLFLGCGNFLNKD